MFYIVEFLETQEVEVVPTVWVEDDLCHWPTLYTPEEVQAAIHNEEPPGHMWDAYRVRILCTTATYKTISLKIPQGGTNTEQPVFQKAAEEEDDSPKKKRKSTTKPESDTDDEDPFKQLRTFPPAAKIKAPNYETPPAVKRRIRRPADPRKNATVSEKCPETRRFLTFSQPQQQEQSQTQSGATALSGLSSLLHKILTNQAKMMDQLRVIQMAMQKTGEPIGGQEVLDRDTLPLKDTSSMLALERRLREEPELKNKVITALSVIGGVDVKDSVWRVMKHCFTNSLAKQLNWRGINGKTAFHRLQLKDVITGTVRNNRLTSNATDQEVEAYIKRWLHLAGDRDGGRREREGRRLTVQGARLLDCQDADQGLLFK